MKLFRCKNKRTGRVVVAKSGLTLLIACGVKGEELAKLGPRVKARLISIHTHEEFRLFWQRRPAAILNFGFNWSSSPQGYAYWCAVHDALFDWGLYEEIQSN